jgi:DNA repair protein REV1
MGHGRCQTFNKQTPLAGPDGRATNDPIIIRDHAMKLLRAFNFDPKELRGISLQIQKLEKTSSVVPTSEAGQSRLAFSVITKPDAPLVQSSTRVEDEDQEPVIEAPTGPGGKATEGVINAEPQDLLLPSFSQVDQDVLAELPDDVRAEIEAELARKKAEREAIIDLSEFTSPPPDPANNPPPLPNQRTKGPTANVKRITQQLAPKNRSPVSPSKNRLFEKRGLAPGAENLDDVELYELGIDPEIFRALPMEVQKEQLVLQRHFRAGGTLSQVTKRKVLKPKEYRLGARSRSPSVSRPRAPPPPQANIPEPPSLKQLVLNSEGKKEKLRFTEAEDVQRLIERWVDGFHHTAPGVGDIEFFAQFLLKCMDSTPGRAGTDSGIEKAIQIVKWWLLLLRRHWGAWESETMDAHFEADKDEGQVAHAWWRAFRDVKNRMDAVARKRFGGKLSFR